MEARRRDSGRGAVSPGHRLFRWRHADPAGIRAELSPTRCRSRSRRSPSRGWLIFNLRERSRQLPASWHRITSCWRTFS